MKKLLFYLFLLTTSNRVLSADGDLLKASIRNCLLFNTWSGLKVGIVGKATRVFFNKIGLVEFNLIKYASANKKFVSGSPDVGVLKFRLGSKPIELNLKPVLVITSEALVNESASNLFGQFVDEDIYSEQEANFYNKNCGFLMNYGLRYGLSVTASIGIEQFLKVFDEKSSN